CAPCLPQLECGAECKENSLGCEWLLQKVHGADLGCAHCVAKRCAPAHHDHREIGPALANLCESGDSVHSARHHEIDQRDVRLFFLDCSYAGGAVRRFTYFVAFSGEKRADHPANVRLVVNDQYALHAASGPSRSFGQNGSVRLHRRCGRRRRRNWSSERGGRAGAHFRQQLGGEPLAFGDALDFRSHGLDGLLDSIEPREQLAGWQRIARRARLHAFRLTPHQWYSSTMPSIISIPLTGTIISGPISNSPCCSVHVFEHARIALVQQPGSKALSLANPLDLRGHRFHAHLHALEARHDVSNWQLRLLALRPLSTAEVHDAQRQNCRNRYEAYSTDECSNHILVHRQASAVKASIGRVNSIMVPVPMSLCADTDPSCAHTA